MFCTSRISPGHLPQLAELVLPRCLSRRRHSSAQRRVWPVLMSIRVLYKRIDQQEGVRDEEGNADLGLLVFGLALFVGAIRMSLSCTTQLA